MEARTTTPLRFRDLREGLRLGPSTWTSTPQEVRAYVEITGDDNLVYHDPVAARAVGLDGPITPPGMIGIWARRAYLANHHMQPGGVMAAQDVELVRPVPVGVPVTLSAEIVLVDHAHPRRRVVVVSEVTGPDGLVARVRIDARWPPDEEST